MNNRSSLPHLRANAAALILVLLATAPGAAQTTLSAQTSVDVRKSFELLSKTFYRNVDVQSILEGARTGLEAEARKRGVRLTAPELHPSTDDDKTAAAIDAAIESTADAAHGSSTDFAYAAIAGMANAIGDKYTQFMTPDQYTKFSNVLDPERIPGVGVLIETDAATQYTRVYYVLPGSPADHLAIRAGDLIQEVDGTTTKGLATDAVSKLLKGQNGSTVRLLVQRPGSDVRLVTAVRSVIQPPTVVYRMLPGDIGYVEVGAFGRGTPSEFDVALQRVKDAGAKALVLDLRNNGGGYVDSALDISSRFISRKALVTVQERGAPDETIDAEDDVRINVPVTVLVNQYTASASEITAGALQDDGIGTLIGTKTFGKGVMQTLTRLPDGAAIKITTAHYLTPNRHDINLRGIDPDVRVDQNRDIRFGDLEKDAQLRAAIAFLSKRIADAKP